jgi:hypothetical protein
VHNFILAVFFLWHLKCYFIRFCYMVSDGGVYDILYFVTITGF